MHAWYVSAWYECSAARMLQAQTGYAAILFALVREQLLIVRYCDIPALLIP